MKVLEINKAEMTVNTSLPHLAASKVVDMKQCTCQGNGMCKTCDAWIMAVRYFKATPAAIKLI